MLAALSLGYQNCFLVGVLLNPRTSKKHHFIVGAREEHEPHPHSLGSALLDEALNTCRVFITNRAASGNDVGPWYEGDEDTEHPHCREILFSDLFDLDISAIRLTAALWLLAGLNFRTFTAAEITACNSRRDRRGELILTCLNAAVCARAFRLGVGGELARLLNSGDPDTPARWSSFVEEQTGKRDPGEARLEQIRDDFSLHGGMERWVCEAVAARQAAA